ncbi:MAG: UDP-N-acetylglucosamine 1-carboxyvinyltransferase [Rickettsiales bacterium]|nr:UDP-N-acetylglucosamine 1-carboxyvinyltransferase [Rickettsiales bacterium]
MMKKMVLEGKCKLVGKIKVSGAKNSALKMICASVLLKNGTLKLSNIPNLLDMTTLIYLQNHLGGKMILDGDLSNHENGKVIILDNKDLNNYIAPYSIVSQMRASFVILGPLLARFGKAEVSLPGGCAIGSRPVDIHLDAFKEMGVDIKIEDGYVKAVCKNGKLQGANIELRSPSVGATENIMMAATLAEGITRIGNAAKEPEIIDLANCLIAMGAKIKGVGTPDIEIIGVKDLHSAEYCVMGDRMEAASYMIGALMTDGDLTITGLDFYNTLENLIEKLTEIGASIKKINNSTIRIKRSRKKLKPINVVTDVYPGFATDMQAQIVTLLAMIDGESTVDETIFENRFMHVPELNRMGANITVIGNRAVIEGKDGCYKNAQVMASDLRASVSLVLAGLCAEGKTEVGRIYHLERGYEFLAEKLNNCGAKIQVVYDKSEN